VTDDCTTEMCTSTFDVAADMTKPILSSEPVDTKVFCEADIPGDQGVTATDNCDGIIPITVSYNQMRDETFPDSIIISNTWSTTDCAGNDTSYTQIVTFIPKQAGLELIKSSSITNTGANSLTQEGDTIFYEFTITNTGNAELINIVLSDPDVSGLSCDSITLNSLSSGMCSAYYIVTQDDINNGSVCNSAIVNGQTSEGVAAQDTSDSGNPLDDTGREDDKTFTYLNQEEGIELFKTLGSINDLNVNGITDEGDEIVYKFKVVNTGNVTLYNLSIIDLLIPVAGSIVELNPGEEDSTSFTAVYPIINTDAAIGYVENSATVNATLPPSIGGTISDISDAGNNTIETPAGDGSIDNDPTNDPLAICVVNQIQCPNDSIISSCATQLEVDQAFQDWLNRVQDGGCGTTVGIIGNPMAPLSCGGSVTVGFQLLDALGDPIPDYDCSATFSVSEDIEGPMCPVNWNITIAGNANNCLQDGYISIAELESETGNKRLIMNLIVVMNLLPTAL